MLLLSSSAATAAEGIVITIDYGRSWPRSLLADSARGVVYVDGMSGIYPPTGFSFGLINSTTHRLERVLPLNVTAGEMALDPATGDVYVAGANEVEVFDGATQAFVKLLKVGVPISDIAFDSATGHLFLTSGNSVYSVNPQDGSLLGNVPVGKAAEGVAVDSSAGILYVSSYLTCSVAVLRAEPLELAATVDLPAPCYPSQLALDAATHSLYVASGSNAVDVVDTAARAYDRSIAVSTSGANATFAIALDERTGQVFALTEPGRTVTQIDVSSGALVRRFQLGFVAYELTVDQTTGELYVSAYHDVIVIVPATGGLGPLLPQYVAGATAAAAVAAAVLLLLRKRMKSAS